MAVEDDADLPAGLVHISDGEPGLRRKRAGRGFCYIGLDGRKVSDPDTLSRIRALAIPPAWTDVWISPSAAGHFQASGRDQRGRKQYRYHPDWIACRDAAKFEKLAEFARALPAIRRRVQDDMRRRNITRERVIASVVWLLDRTFVRIGNDHYARENGSYGLTTLRSRHVDLNGGTVRFSFKGKSGREWQIKLSDRRIAATVGKLEELPGQHLFQYLDDDGDPHPIQSSDVNAYLREASGTDFTSKHFRTWAATKDAALELGETPLPTTQSGRARLLNAVIDRIAARLRNTRAVCRACYVHPEVISEWENDRLAARLGDLKRRYRRPLAHLDRGETIVLRWLEKADGGVHR
jgi:DNA topoisomerase I